MPKKIAVICFNLGGPNSLEAVQPFLFNLFSDQAIIRLPQPLRYMIAKLISSKRAPIAKDIYRQIGNKSPILELTKKQLAALDEALNENEKIEYKSFIAMRYWHPFTNEVVRQVKDWQADELILLPLYPQFSTTTSASSIREWKKEAKKAGLNTPTKTICCYPTEEHFVNAHLLLVQNAIKQAGEEPYRILFSAHGLPEKIVKSGDPYQWQVERTTEAVVSQLTKNLGQDLDYSICYQSRVGPMKWIGPSTEEEIKRAGEDGKTIILVPIAFVSEHSETLVELDIEYKKLADESGVKHYIRVPALGTQPEFITALKRLVLQAADSEKSCISSSGGRICPEQFNGCICLKEG